MEVVDKESARETKTRYKIRVSLLLSHADIQLARCDWLACTELFGIEVNGFYM